jgi:UDP-3-O-[3-hydroxymyristoyl] glucosamine N-acyltransferase
MKRTLKQVAAFLRARVQGDSSIEVAGVASIQSASTGDLVFVEDEKTLSAALNSPATAVIAAEPASKKAHAKPILVCEQPRLAFARAASLLTPPAPSATGVHASAVCDPSVRLGTNVSVGPHTSIAEGVTIGSGTRIGPGCCIGARVRVGTDCNLIGNVTIYPGTSLGDRVIVHAGAVLGSDGFGYVRDARAGRYEKFPQIGRLEIGDDVEIGANSTIDRGALDVTRIGRGSKIDNLVHVGHNVQIGEDVVIAALTGISGSVVVEDDVVMGGQVGIGDHAHIESGTILGGGAGVLTNKIVRGKGIVFWGRPARPVREYLKELAMLARLSKKGG